MVATGSDVESICAKCGDVWHVVVAMVGDKIAKVQCKECGAYHRYRPAGGTKKKVSSPRKRAAGAAKKKPAATATPTGPTVEPALDRPAQPYSIKQTYQVADRVDHPKFGIGVVETAQRGKIEVYFPDGRRTLAQAKEALKLSRPDPFEHD